MVYVFNYLFLFEEGWLWNFISNGSEIDEFEVIVVGENGVRVIWNG